MVRFIWSVFQNEDVKYLKHFPTLQVLILSYTYIDDKSINSLLSLKKLELLDVGYTNITKKGAELLKKSLPECEVDY